MKQYTVYGPITGRFCITVEAENEQEAIDIALGSLENGDIEEWDVGPRRDIDVEELDE